MLELTIKKRKYLLAEDWCDVNFGQYINILNVQQDKWNDLDRSIKLICALSDKPAELEKDLLNEMDLEDLTSLSENMIWINGSIEEAASKMEEKDFFLIDNQKYVIKKNYKKLTLGEMVSLETILKDPNFNNQEAALGILIRQIDDKGKEADFDEEFFFYVVNELKYKINLVEVYKYINFFLSGVQTSTTKNSKGFSIRKV